MGALHTARRRFRDFNMAAITTLSILTTLVLVASHFGEGANWAVIVAGANKYENYRHQANTCHAYHIMLKHGIPRERIVTMMYDDIANNRRNPYKGNIINEPGGENVYEGVKIDYRGRSVTSGNFLKVLQGLATNEGSGRVLETGPDDHIFVYYSDHGGNGFLHFPSGLFNLYARSLNNALTSMHKRRRYAKMVIYVEACHSGSMFHHRLRSDINVWAMTAANPGESSYACCWDARRKTFLGDHFSGNWMRDTEHHDISHETLYTQYTNTQHATRTSHVSLYGDSNGMASMDVGEFQGIINTLLKKQKTKASTSNKMDISEDLVSSWDVAYEALVRQLQESNTTSSRLDLLKQLEAEQQARVDIETTLRDIAMELGSSIDSLKEIRDILPSDELDDCYEASVEFYLHTCNSKHRDNDYRLRNMQIFMNLCNSGVTQEKINKAIKNVCM